MSDATVSHSLVLSGVCRTYRQGADSLEILRGVDLSIAPGETVGLIAASGAGKSTLLHVAGLLEAPDAGDVVIGGASTRKMDDKGRTALRRRTIGFVYQFHHLLPEFSARENVMLPQMIGGLNREEAGRRADDLLKWLGLEERRTHRPAELSGGEQQRVALARAVANAPRVLLADEPTGNLDPSRAEHVFETLTTLVRATGVAALIATHNLDLAARLDRRVTLRDGLIEEVT